MTTGKLDCLVRLLVLDSIGRKDNGDTLPTLYGIGSSFSSTTRVDAHLCLLTDIAGHDRRLCSIEQIRVAINLRPACSKIITRQAGWQAQPSADGVSFSACHRQTRIDAGDFAGVIICDRDHRSCPSFVVSFRSHLTPVVLLASVLLSTLLHSISADCFRIVRNPI